LDNPIKMEVGIEDFLHIEFEYNKQKYHMHDVIQGKISFVLVRLRIKRPEMARPYKIPLSTAGLALFLIVPICWSLLICYVTVTDSVQSAATISIGLLLGLILYFPFLSWDTRTLDFARLTQLWRAKLRSQRAENSATLPQIHPSAVVDAEATVDPSARIGALCVVERGLGLLAHLRRDGQQVVRLGNGHGALGGVHRVLA
jgi:hypothetical protein